MEIIYFIVFLTCMFAIYYIFNRLMVREVQRAIADLQVYIYNYITITRQLNLIYQDETLERMLNSFTDTACSKWPATYDGYHAYIKMAGNNLSRITARTDELKRKRDNDGA